MCDKKLDFVFQFFSPAIDGEPDKLYSLFYCHDCKPTVGLNGYKVTVIENPDFSRFSIDNSIRSPHTYAYFDLILNWQVPDWNYLELFSPEIKNNFVTTYMNNAEDLYIKESENTTSRNHAESYNYFGGYPNFLDEPMFPMCLADDCEGHMDLFLQLDSNKHLNLKWLNNGCLYLFKCKNSDHFKILIQ